VRLCYKTKYCASETIIQDEVLSFGYELARSAQAWGNVSQYGSRDVLSDDPTSHHRAALTTMKTRDILSGARLSHYRAAQST
jgi:hypothetical protein